MTEITGYSIKEINLKGWYQTVYPDPDIQRMAIKRMEEMRQGNGLLDEEWEIIRADGRKRCLYISHHSEAQFVVQQSEQRLSDNKTSDD